MISALLSSVIKSSGSSEAFVANAGRLTRARDVVAVPDRVCCQAICILPCRLCQTKSNAPTPAPASLLSTMTTTPSSSSSFVGGALSFKGNKKKAKKKTKKSPSSASSLKQSCSTDHDAASTSNDLLQYDDDLTDAEKKALRKKRERERQELEIVAKKSHRERVEEFNQALASVTEHNDIPRVRERLPNILCWLTSVYIYGLLEWWLINYYYCDSLPLDRSVLPETGSLAILPCAIDLLEVLGSCGFFSILDTLINSLLYTIQ
jgi:protein FAM32A